MVTVGLLVHLEAKPGKEADVERFLEGGLALVDRGAGHHRLVRREDGAVELRHLRRLPVRSGSSGTSAGTRGRGVDGPGSRPLRRAAGHRERRRPGGQASRLTRSSWATPRIRGSTPTSTRCPTGSRRSAGESAISSTRPTRRSSETIKRTVQPYFVLARQHLRPAGGEGPRQRLPLRRRDRARSRGHHHRPATTTRPRATIAIREGEPINAPALTRDLPADHREQPRGRLADAAAGSLTGANRRPTSCRVRAMGG